MSKLSREDIERTLNNVVGVYNRYGRQAGITAMAAALAAERRAVWNIAFEQIRQQDDKETPA